ncbi:amidase domain-containing protein [Streptomyces decoyicus]|uniref:amidase domain-containing protein n=2 Tax=Streptomyces decoyicus TaxID=249567 RepID=UPI000A592315|nr:amidase domain-containing protein [Streptomyces decoyicus]QZY17241.1 amidase domain-containing protein [Streptomyces decoyicus]
MPLECPAPNAAADKQQAYNDIVAVREQALRQATEADEKTAAELYRLAGTVGISGPDKALKEQNRASHVEMDMLAADIPKANTDPAAVRAWWNGLSEKQQYDMMRAEPVKLAQLDGIPENAKREMRGTDGKFDRVKMVEYALENWNKKDPIQFDNNCTNFVSQARPRRHAEKDRPLVRVPGRRHMGKHRRHRHRLGRREPLLLPDLGRSGEPAELHAQARWGGSPAVPGAPPPGNSVSASTDCGKHCGSRRAGAGA